MSESLIPLRRDRAAMPAVAAGQSAEESLFSAAFTRWEQRGRGWILYDYPVELEPPFCPLYHLVNAPAAPIADDGRKPTFWSKLFDDLTGSAAGRGASGSAVNSTDSPAYRQAVAAYESQIAEGFEPLFSESYNHDYLELQLTLPKDLKLPKGVAENLLLGFSHTAHPVGFEIIGNRRQIVIQFVCTERDAPHVRQQLKAHLPDCPLRETTDYLSGLWINGAAESLIVDFGLSNDCSYPLKTSSPVDADYLVTAIGAVSNLEADEIGVLQILFQKTQNDWAAEIIESVGYLEQTGQVPKNASHFAKEKTRSPMFAVCVRVAGRSCDKDGAWRIVRGLGAGLASFSAPSSNELIPLAADDYPAGYHEQALLNRLSFRCGMLLNLEELALMVHPPSPLVRSDKLVQLSDLTKAAPNAARHQPAANVVMLGENCHQGIATDVSLSDEQRTRHIHLIGSSGSGKSNLMLNLIKQDAENGQGLCVIDPHGDLIDDVIAHLPERRIKDVVLFDPADAEFPVGFNILKANSELEKTLLSSDLVAVFRRMSTSWGDVMDSVLANAILAFVESTRGGTLFDLKRFLIEKDFRNDFLNTVDDEAIKYFWRNEFPLIVGKPQSSILIRLDTFLRQKLIRNIVCQKENKIDFRRVMDERKILLVKLSQGAIGEENAYLLGTLLVSKLYQTALSRQDTQNRPFFSCYLDEFHHFITPSMESVLSGVRKYNLGLVLAHQEFRQLQSRNAEVASSVLSNCYTRICFRLGDQDAEKFASGFSFFDGKALQNLGIGEAIARVERAEYDFNLQTNLLPKVPNSLAAQRRLSVVKHSRENYAAQKAEVEANLFTGQNKPTITDDAVTKSLMTDLQKPKESQSKIKTEKPSTGASFEVNDKTTSNPEADHGHRYLQSIIKRIGENHGFVSTLEKQVFGGIGKVDVALESEHLKIACEVAVSNTVQYEIQNIQKCLASGFEKVVVVSNDPKHLANIRKQAEAVIAEAQFAKVHFLEPENFHLFLESLAQKADTKNKIKGYTVNINFKANSESEDASRKQTVFEILKQVIRRKGGK